MGHIENIDIYMERTFKYLHFARGTFKKMSKQILFIRKTHQLLLKEDMLIISPKVKYLEFITLMMKF